jgi:1-deoxy-D-xylulose-5-phosphate synthase
MDVSISKSSGLAQRIAILTFGSMLYPALQAAQALDATVVNMRWAKPLDLEMLTSIAQTHDALVCVEEGCKMGGAGSAVLEALQAMNQIKPVLLLGLPDEFIDHGDHAKLLQLQGLDAAGIQASIEKWRDLVLPNSASGRDIHDTAAI